VDFDIPDEGTGHLSFTIVTKGAAGFEVEDEECVFYHPESPRVSYYRVKAGIPVALSIPSPAVVPDRLALVNYAGHLEFRPVFDALSRMNVYNLSPEAIGSIQQFESDGSLRPDGSNSASVLWRAGGSTADEIGAYLARIVPGLKQVEAIALGDYVRLEFSQTFNGEDTLLKFSPSSMSDGTLRAFGILLATLPNSSESPLFLGIEEPETAIHPAATRVLLSALRAASDHRQIMVTSHSPDLLDDPDLQADSILQVVSINGFTLIGPVDNASRDVLRQHLFTPGELLRMNQLDIDSVSGVAVSRPLFEVVELEQ
jgi:hypothetical protein